MSDCVVDQHPHSPPHPSSFPPFLYARWTRLKAGGGADSPSDKATRPHLTFQPISSLTLPQPFLSHNNTDFTLSLLVGVQGRGQPVRPAGGLVCGTVLISTAVWRQKPRYLPPPPLLHTSPIPTSSLTFSGRLSRLLPSCRVHRQVCEGCRCQLSFHGWVPTSLRVYSLLPFLCLFPSLLPFFLTTFHFISINELFILRPYFVFQPHLGEGLCVTFMTHWCSSRNVGLA